MRTTGNDVFDARWRVERLRRCMQQHADAEVTALSRMRESEYAGNGDDAAAHSLRALWHADQARQYRERFNAESETLDALIGEWEGQ